MPNAETPAEMSPRLRAIEKALIRANAELPALASLLAAFGPLFAAQAVLFEAAPGWQGPAPSVDPDRFSQGVFVLADSGWVKGQRPVPFDGWTLPKSLWIGQGHD